jgi:hypothetical protein
MAWTTAVLHGRLARISVGGTATDAATTNIDWTSRWSLNWNRDIATFGRQGQTYKNTFGGQANWSGSLEFAFIRATAAAENDELTALQGLAVSSALDPTSVVKSDVLFCLGTTGQYLNGDFWVTGYSVDAPVGDIVKCNLTITGSGPIQFSSAT